MVGKRFTWILALELSSTSLSGSKNGTVEDHEIPYV
jgi:hypothetical protein